MTEELILLLGIDAFVKFSCVFGGTKFYVGVNENTEKKLTVVMGVEAAKKLIKAYSEAWIYVPKYSSVVINSRNALIVQDCDAGLTLNELARKYELSQQQICYILKKPSRPPA